ncbi:MAG TPA: hypothetical protein V6C90_18095, partial [Coleofasciculaceae cyanobacterium]
RLVAARAEALTQQKNSSFFLLSLGKYLNTPTALDVLTTFDVLHSPLVREVTFFAFHLPSSFAVTGDERRLIQGTRYPLD